MKRLAAQVGAVFEELGPFTIGRGRSTNIAEMVRTFQRPPL